MSTINIKEIRWQNIKDMEITVDGITQSIDKHLTVAETGSLNTKKSFLIETLKKYDINITGTPDT
jgi:hypothetical protein